MYSKHNVDIRKEIDSILNTFLDKANINKNEYKTLNNYMDLINSKLDSLTYYLNINNDNDIKKEDIKNKKFETIEESLKED